jgi:hypothetical protein
MQISRKIWPINRRKKSININRINDRMIGLADMNPQATIIQHIKYIHIAKEKHEYEEERNGRYMKDHRNIERHK